jgi:peroxiredoxin
MADNPALRSPVPGEKAPDFVFDTPDGTILTLSDLKAHRTLIIFQRHLG